jgi:Rieske Fe-S protein
MRRRRLLEIAGGALGTLAVASLPGCAALVATPVTPLNGVVRLTLRNHPQLEQPGGYLRIRPTGAPDPLYVLNNGGGRFVVLSPICTHLQCTVALEGTQFLCPCHGSLYDRDGAVLRGPAMRALRRYPAELTHAGELIIQLGGDA